MLDIEDLERRLLPRKTKGTPEEFWQLAVRRTSLADAEKEAGREKQHLALAALFAGRGFQAGERDGDRLRAYAEMFRRARGEGCFPEDLRAVESRVSNQLRLAGGNAEPRIIGKKVKTVSTDVAVFLLSDALSFDAISGDDHAWSDDGGMAATVRAGRGLFFCTGADGSDRHEIRILHRDELVLRSTEYENLTSSAEPALLDVPSGVLRLGQPTAKRLACLEIEVEPGVYRVALHALKDGEKWIAVAARTNLTEANNRLPDAAARYGQSRPGILAPG